MSARTHETALRRQAPIFAALGDATRLALLAKLGDGSPHSIAQLSSGSRMSRQAITKHLQIMENVGLVSGMRAGRECRYRIEAKAIKEVMAFLDRVSAQWDAALLRLKDFVES